MKGKNMNNTVFMILVLCTFLVCALAVFALFAIGFLIGYKLEDRRFLKNKHKDEKADSAEEKKLKKEWKKFLEYDGSTPIKYE